MSNPHVDMIKLRQAIETSWQPDSAYEQANEPGNPALGQCHVTALAAHHYYPEAG